MRTETEILERREKYRQILEERADLDLEVLVILEGKLTELRWVLGE